MSQPGKALYDLRAPTSGAGVKDPRSAILMWGAMSAVVGLVSMFLLVGGHFRFLILLLLGLLALLSVAPRRGVYVLMMFLPFMYFIRREILNFEAFSGRDPVLLFPAIATILMTFSAVIFYGSTIFHYSQRSTPLKIFLILQIWFTLQVFNPLQGGIFVGLAGALYFIIPMLFCVIGVLIRREDMSRILRMIVAIGCITALYGIYQHFFGLSEVEEYALKAKGFYKTLGDGGVRIISTFAGFVDFSRYLAVSGFLTFAYFWRKKQHWVLVPLLGIQLYAMLYTASRTSFLAFLFGIAMFLVVEGNDLRRIVWRGAFSLVIVVGLYAYFGEQDPRRLYSQRFSTNPFVVHTVSGMTNPTSESSFQSRTASWKYIVGSAFTRFPVGRGLGSTTPAALKFRGGRYFEADSYLFELFYGSGLPAPILLIGLWFLCIRYLLTMCVEAPGDALLKYCLGVSCILLLTSVFGVSARGNILGPITWLVIGWVLKEKVDRSTPIEAVEPQPRETSG